jgi:hypothetical protein
MNKNQQYETAYVIPALRRHLFANTEGGKEETLTEKEQRLKKILSKANSETLIGISIHERLSSGSIRSFREMIKELHEQSLVAKNELIRAIGSEAVDLIESIS